MQETTTCVPFIYVDLHAFAAPALNVFHRDKPFQGLYGGLLVQMTFTVIFHVLSNNYANQERICQVGMVLIFLAFVKLLHMARKNPHAVALGRLGGARGGKIAMENRTPEERAEFARMGGLVGGKRSAANLTEKQRKERARKAAQARWGNKGKA
jgi:hypothetical protein